MFTTLPSSPAHGGTHRDAHGGTTPPPMGEDVNAVLEVAGRAGAIMLANGAPSAETASAMAAMCRSQGLYDVRVRVSYDHLSLTNLVEGELPVHRMVGIQTRDFDLGRYTEAATLIDGVTKRRIGLADARAAVRTIRTAAAYPRWVTLLGAIIAGASAAVVFGGGWLVILFAAVANVIADVMFRSLAPRGWPIFFLQVASGILGVLAATVVHLLDKGTNPSVVVISVIIVMLAGMTSTGAVQDAITGWYQSAIGRLFDALVKTAGLVVGVKMGLQIVNALGHPLPVSPRVSWSAMDYPTLAVAAGVIALGFTLAVQAPLRTLPASALLTAGAFVGYLLLQQGGMSIVWAAGVAATVIGVAGTLLAQRLRAPVAAFALPAVIPMLPGLMLYQGLMLSTAEPMAAWGRFGTALSIALAIACGMVFGEYAAVLLIRPLKMIDHRVFAPLFAAPFATRRLARRGAAGAKVDESEADFSAPTA